MTNQPRAEIDAVLRSPTVQGFMRRHREVESAPRWVCPECQFEQNEHYQSHAPGCSQRALGGFAPTPPGNPE